MLWDRFVCATPTPPVRRLFRQVFTVERCTATALSDAARSKHIVSMNSRNEFSQSALLSCWCTSLAFSLEFLRNWWCISWMYLCVCDVCVHVCVCVASRQRRNMAAFGGMHRTQIPFESCYGDEDDGRRRRLLPVARNTNDILALDAMYALNAITRMCAQLQCERISGLQLCARCSRSAPLATAPTKTTSTTTSDGKRINYVILCTRNNLFHWKTIWQICAAAAAAASLCHSPKGTCACRNWTEMQRICTELVSLLSCGAQNECMYRKLIEIFKYIFN